MVLLCAAEAVGDDPFQKRGILKEHLQAAFQPVSTLENDQFIGGVRDFRGRRAHLEESVEILYRFRQAKGAA